MTGALGDGAGRVGGVGVLGYATNNPGVGISAQNAHDGIALEVTGAAAFSRSGIATVPAGASSVTVIGVSLKAASFVLATVQQAVPGVFVESVARDPANSAFTIHLKQEGKRRRGMVRRQLARLRAGRHGRSWTRTRDLRLIRAAL